MSPGDDVIPYRLTDDTRLVNYQDITPSQPVDTNQIKVAVNKQKCQLDWSFFLHL